jgi:hypothetical protein
MCNKIVNANLIEKIESNLITVDGWRFIVAVIFWIYDKKKLY